MKIDHDAVPAATARGSVSNQVISRRKMMTNVVALGTAIASPSLAADAGDQQLLLLGAEFDARLAAFRAANDRYFELQKVAHAKHPPCRDALRVRRWDRILLRGRLPHIGNFALGSEYDNADVLELARAKIYRDRRRRPTEEEKSWYPQDENGWVYYRSPWPVAQKRADEIIAAHDAQIDACDRIDQETGYDAAIEADEAADDALFETIDKVIATPAQTEPGRRVKARVTSYIVDRLEGRTSEQSTGDEETDVRLIRSLLADLLRDDDPKPAAPAAAILLNAVA